MKKYLLTAGGVIVLQLINSDILSWLVLSALVWWAIVKFFPIFMEGSK